MVRFAHVVGLAEPNAQLPNVGRLPDFLRTFGSLIFYQDHVSGESAVHLAPASQWPDLDSDFRDWIDHLSEDERQEFLPEWVDKCLVIGEEPATGNYLLMAVDGSEPGAVYLFDHDGFEFTREAGDVIEYVERMLTPDNRALTGFASHMRFRDGDPRVQWWILDLNDNRGHTATTRA